MTVQLSQHNQAALDLAIEIEQTELDIDPNTAHDLADKLVSFLDTYAAGWDADAMLAAAIVGD
jgi:hypothetical protein